MKIIMATPYFYPRVGGLELYAQQMAAQLVARGHEVHIVTSGKQRETVVLHGLTVHRLRAWTVISNTPVSPTWTRQIRRIVRDVRPDVMNVHAPVPSMALAAAAAAGRTPLVVTYHAGSMKKGRALVDSVIGLYEHFALPWMLAKAARIICASEFVRNDFLGLWEDKTITVTPGVDVERFVPSAAPAVRGRVAFVGDFRDPRKGIDVLRSAIKLLPGASLRIIGQGSPVPQDNVSYAGVKRGQDLVAELQRAELLVLPSTTDAESFGMVLIEAMACGLPVIGSNVGGIKHVISDGRDGLLVPPKDPQALAAAMAVILRDPAYGRQLGRNGRYKVARIMSWSRRGALTEAVLFEASEAGQARLATAEVRHG